MKIPPVGFRQLVSALKLANEAAAKCDPLDPTDSPMNGALITIVAHWRGKPKARAIGMRFMLLLDLSRRPMLKRAWTREHEGQGEISEALIRVAASIPYTINSKVSSRLVNRLAKALEADD